MKHKAIQEGGHGIRASRGPKGFPGSSCHCPCTNLTKMDLASNELNKSIEEHIIKGISLLPVQCLCPASTSRRKRACGTSWQAHTRSALESVLGTDIGIDHGNRDVDDDDGIAHENESSAMGKEGKDISDNKVRGSKLEASVPTFRAGDALELRAPSATGSNPRQPTTASTIAAFPVGFFSLRLRRIARSGATVNMCSSSAQVNPVEVRGQASCFFDAVSSSLACLFLASSSSFAFHFSAAVRIQRTTNIRGDWTLVPQHGACQVCALCCGVHNLFSIV